VNENVTDQPIFANGIGWCRAVADRPYFDDISLANADDVSITVRIDTLPPPTNYESE
jgi:hypothetical protein